MPDPDDLRPLEAVTALLDGPLSTSDVTGTVSEAVIHSPALAAHGERLLLLSALHRAGALDERFFVTLRRRQPRRRREIDAAQQALREEDRLLPLVKVLSTMFGISDLRIFVQEALGRDALPGHPERHTAKAAGAALVLQRRDLIQPPLFDRLVMQHPEKADLIRHTAAHSLPREHQFGYLYDEPDPPPPQPTHHLRIRTRLDQRGQRWIGAELRTPEGRAAGWHEWPEGEPLALPMLAALPEGTLLLIALPEPALAVVDWESADAGGVPLGARLITCRRLGALRPAVTLARFNTVEITADAVAEQFAASHAALGRVRMGPRAAFGDLHTVRRTLEGREPVDIVHINAFDAGDGRLSLTPGGEAIGPDELTVSDAASRYAARRMAYLNLCGTPDTVAWVQRLQALGFQAVVAATDPIAPAAADAAAAAFYDAATQRKVTLAEALQRAQQAVPEAAGRLALYAEPTSRLRA